MKIKLTLILTLCFSLLGIIGCNNSSPKKIVNNYLNSVRNGNNSDLNDYLNSEIEKVQANTVKINSNTDLDYDLDYAIDTMYENLKFDILEEAIDGKSATVTVKIIGANLGKVLSEFFKDGVVPSLNNTYNLELVQKNLMLLLIEKINNATITDRTIEINLDKAKGNWIINEDDSLFKSILGILE